MRAYSPFRLLDKEQTSALSRSAVSPLLLQTSLRFPYNIPCGHSLFFTPKWKTGQGCTEQDNKMHLGSVEEQVELSWAACASRAHVDLVAAHNDIDCGQRQDRVYIWLAQAAARARASPGLIPSAGLVALLSRAVPCLRVRVEERDFTFFCARIKFEKFLH